MEFLEYPKIPNLIVVVGFYIPFYFHIDVIPRILRTRGTRPDGKELGDGHTQTSGQEDVQSQSQGATDETCEAAKSHRF